MAAAGASGGGGTGRAPAIRLHHVPQTRSMRVLWLLHELGEPFDVRVWPFDRSLRSPEHLALNPVGRTPALEMDGRAYWESGAIIQILCERFPDVGLGRRPGTPEWADWLTWLHFAETISGHAQVLTQQHIMLREDRMRSAAITQLEPRRIGKCYDAIEAGLMGEWLLPSGFSAADVAVGQAVYMARMFAPVEDRPRMTAWWSRIEAREAYRASLPREGEARLYARTFYPPLETIDG